MINNQIKQSKQINGMKNFIAKKCILLNKDQGVKKALPVERGCKMPQEQAPDAVPINYKDDDHALQHTPSIHAAASAALQLNNKH